MTTSLITSGRVEYLNELGWSAVDRACADVCNDEKAVICDPEAIQRSLQASPPASPRSFAGSLPLDPYDRVASRIGGWIPNCSGFTSADPYEFGALALCNGTNCFMGYFESCEKTYPIVCCH